MTTFKAVAIAAAILSMSAAPLVRAVEPALPSASVYRLALPLTDAQGRKQDWNRLQGKPRIVAMFYTSCPYMCPLIVESGKAVERALPAADRDRVGVVLISLDPAHDTPAKLRETAGQRNIDLKRWVLATPATDDVRKVAGVLGVRYRLLEDGNFNHTSALVLLDAQGRILARTEQVGAKPDPAFVKAVRAAL